MAKTIVDEMPDDEMRPVLLPSGATFRVHVEEQEYFTDRVQRYLKDNSFTNIADLQDLDRIMIGELLVYRWGSWAARGRNYWGDPVDDAALQKQYKEMSAELRQVKSALQLDKVSRDRQRGEDSVSKFIENLGVRALHFGYKRNNEVAKIMELFQELRSLVTLYRNSTEDERRDLRIGKNQVSLSLESIVKWLEEVAFVEYDEIDRKFRQEGSTITKMNGTTSTIDGQRTWVREL